MKQYCPNIEKCPWVLEMLCKNRSNDHINSSIIPDCVECLLLLHSPFIFDMKVMESLFNIKDGNNVEIDDAKNDEYNVDTKMNAINKYCSSFVFITRCIYTKTEKYFGWLHSYNIYGLYNNFCDLLAFLICTSLDGVKAMHIVDFSRKGDLMNNLQTKEGWKVIENMNNYPSDLLKFSTSLNGNNNKNVETAFPKHVEVKMNTIQSLLLDHYTPRLVDAYWSKSKQGIQNFKPHDVFNNTAIIDVRNACSNDYDNEISGVTSKASQLSLNISSIVEMAYEQENLCNSAYSVEAISASRANFKFHIPKDWHDKLILQKFELCCDCCEENVFTDNSRNCDELPESSQ
jgi:hypothetical protein